MQESIVDDGPNGIQRPQNISFIIRVYIAPKIFARLFKILVGDIEPEPLGRGLGVGVNGFAI